MGALDWKAQKVPLSKLPSIYASLAKSRLTGLSLILFSKVSLAVSFPYFYDEPRQY